MMLAICHRSLRSVLSPSNEYMRDPLASDRGTRRLAFHVYLWNHVTYGTRWRTCHVYLWGLSPSPSDLWDPMDLWDLMAYVSRVSVGPSDLWDPMDSGTFHHLHSTYGTRRPMCHLLPPRFNKFKLKKTMRPRSRTWDLE